MSAGRSQTASVHDKYRPKAFAHRCDDEFLERFFRRALDHAVHVEVRLHGELAAAKLRHEARIEADAVAFDVFVGLGDVEGRLSRDEVRQSRDYFRVLIDDRVGRGRIERDARARVAVVMDRAYALERTSHQSLVVERFCNRRRGLCCDLGRRRDFGLDRRRRRSACRQHLLQVFEWRRENELRRDHRLSFAVRFVVVVSADVFFLFRHRRERRALGSTTDYAADTTRFKLCMAPRV
jgi:hypothetical protein